MTRNDEEYLTCTKKLSQKVSSLSAENYNRKINDSEKPSLRHS